MKMYSKYLPRLPINGVENDINVTVELHESLGEDDSAHVNTEGMLVKNLIRQVKIPVAIIEI